MTVWLPFGQVKAKAREAGSDTVAGWKLRDANWAEFSQKHLGPLRPISMEILRPDNWMKPYIPILFPSVTVQTVTCRLWSSPQSACYPLHWDPRIKGWHPSYITVHTQCCGSVKCGKEILSASLHAGRRPSPMKVAFWGGLSWNFCWVWEPIASPCSALANRDFSFLVISVLPQYQTLLLPRTFALFIEKTKAMDRNSTNMQSDLCIVMSCWNMGGKIMKFWP